MQLLVLGVLRGGFAAPAHVLLQHTSQTVSQGAVTTAWKLVTKVLVEKWWLRNVDKSKRSVSLVLTGQGLLWFYIL